MIFGSVATSAISADKDVVVIEDIASWNHPVKKVFAKYSITVVKVELFKNGKYPVILR
jgi:hypothetical protein